VNRTVNVIEFHAAVGSEGISLVEFFGVGTAMIGCVRRERENEKRTSGSQNDT
jgi:hypothetical protein